MTHAARPAIAHTTGLVLAGGAGSRMGGAEKGLLGFAGNMLADRAIARLMPQVATALISANRHQDRYRLGNCLVVADRYPDRPGPLADCHAAFSASTVPRVASVPFDAPLFPRAMMARLVQQRDAAPAAGVLTESGR